MIKDLDKIYNCIDSIPEVIYSSHLKKGVKQIVDINFSTAKLIMDKNHNIDHNIEFEAIAVYLEMEDETHNGGELKIVFPKNSFLKMLKNALDIAKSKEIFLVSGYTRIVFRRESIRRYVLEKTNFVSGGKSGDSG